MQAKEVVRRVRELALPICEQVGVLLWDLTFEKEGGSYMLTLTIDKAGGVDIDSCEAVSRALDPKLDAKEFDALPSYTLCVSSAGLTRRLRLPEHFTHYVGHEIELSLYRAREGQKRLCGRLLGYAEGAVTIELPEGAVTIAEKDWAAAHLALTD